MARTLSLLFFCPFLFFPSCRGPMWESSDRIHVSGRHERFGLTVRAEKSETIPLCLDGGETLAVDVKFGEVEIVPSREGPFARATFSLFGPDRARAEKWLSGFSLEKKRRGGKLELMIRGKPALAKVRGREAAIHPKVFLLVRVPEGTPVQGNLGFGGIRVRGPFGETRLVTRFGKIEAEGIRGDFYAFSQGGKIAVGKVNGGRVRLETELGTLELREVRGESIEAGTSTGKIHARDLEAGRIEIASSFGAVDLEKIRGDVEVKTSTGTVKAVEVGGGRAYFESEFGRIEARRISGDLRAETSYGNIRVEGVFGRLDLKSKYGSISARVLHGSRMKADWSMETEAGSVSVNLPPSFSCEVDASTNLGRAVTDLMLSEKRKSSSFRVIAGRFGRGGRTIRLSSKLGNIHILRMDAGGE